MTKDHDLIYRQAALELLETSADLIRRALDCMDLVGAERDKFEWGLGLIEPLIYDMESLPSEQPKAIRPKFVAEDRYLKNYFQMFPHCPKCNYELETGDCYCRVCGCHIDWGEDDE